MTDEESMLMADLLEKFYNSAKTEESLENRHKLILSFTTTLHLVSKTNLKNN